MNRHGYTLITPPAVEPVTLDQAKAHLRVEVADDDDLIAALISAARQLVEKTSHRSLIQQIWRGEYFDFPRDSSALQLAHGPVSAVSSITYIDAAGQAQTLDPSLYVADLNRDIPRISLAPFQCWPPVQCQPAAVKVIYVAGYGADPATVEKGLCLAVLLMIAHWYANRAAVVLENAIFAELPVGARALIDLYTIPVLS